MQRIARFPGENPFEDSVGDKCYGLYRGVQGQLLEPACSERTSPQPPVVPFYDADVVPFCSAVDSNEIAAGSCLAVGVFAPE